MMLTTKGRYAVMALVDIAHQQNRHESRQKTISLSAVATRQEIALSYLEQIFNRLKKQGIVSSVRGPGGGYRLSDQPSKIFISSIINAVEEQIKIVRCDHDSQKGCFGTKGKCVTHDLWASLGDVIESYLDNISLQDVIDKKVRAKTPNFSELEQSNQSKRLSVVG